MSEIKTSNDSIFKINSLKINEEIELLFNNKDFSWINDIITELHEPENESSLPTLSVDLKIKKIKNNAYKEQIIITGLLTGQYKTPCIKCLSETTQILDNQFGVIYLDASMINNEEFENIDTIYAESQNLELYFVKKGEIDLYLLIYEQIFMFADPLPVHSKDCKGLCQFCGVDLNTESCSHTTNLI